MSAGTWTVGDYQFTLTAEASAPAAPYQRDLWYATDDGQRQHLRPFYFDEARPDSIHAFCERYAAEADFRAAIAAANAPFQQRDALFIRNAFNPYFQPNPVLDALGSLARVFKFMTLYHEAIRALSAYQTIQARDTAHVPHPTALDPAIASAVSAWQARADVQTLASCQGVSGTVSYQGIDDIMTVSSHARYAYLWFAQLPPAQVKRLEAYSAHAPHLVFEQTVYPALRSTGDNAAFCRDLLQLAAR